MLRFEAAPCRIVCVCAVACVLLLVSSNLNNWLVMAEFVSGGAARVAVFGPLAFLLVVTFWAVFQSRGLDVYTVDNKALLVFPCVLVLLSLCFSYGSSVKSLAVASVYWLLIGLLLKITHWSRSLLAWLVLSIVFCASTGLLYEQWQSGSFSTVLGRSAFLYMNPNLAGAALGLIVFAGLNFIPRVYRLSYLTLGLMVLVTTLSRSSILAYLCAGLVWLILARKDLFSTLRTSVRSWLLALVIFGLGIGYHLYSYAHAQEFQWAAKASIQSVPEKPAQVPGYIPRVARVYGKGIPANFLDKSTSKISKIEAAKYYKATGVSETELTGEAKAITFRTDNEARSEGEAKSSALARGELLLQSFRAYKQSPWVGHGYDYAFSLSPHNNYLLFAVAFGALGWLVIPLFCWLIWRLPTVDDTCGGRLAAVFVLVVSFFMHDIFSSISVMTCLAFAVFTAASRWDIKNRSKALSGL